MAVVLGRPGKPGGLNLNPAWPFSLAPLPRVPPSYASEVLADAPLLYWRLDDPSGTTATDLSGNGRNGTYGSGVTLNQAGALAFDRDAAVLLDNTSNGVVTSTFNPFASSFTVEGWANRTSTAAGDTLWTGDVTAGPFLRCDSAALSVTFDNDGTSGAGALGWANAWPALGVWVHWAFTFNAVSFVGELFINGVSQGTKTFATINATPGNFRVGVRATATDPFNGSIDEVAVYSGVLGRERIAAHYAARLGPPYVSAINVFPQALTATSTTTSTFTEVVNKTVSATSTSTATSLRQVGKQLSATVTSTATLVAMKVVLLAVTATVVATASIRVLVAKALQATATSTASIVRQTNKALQATAASTATIAAIKVILRTLQATVTSSASFAIRVSKPLSATVPSSASFGRLVGKQIQFTVTSTAIIVALRVFLRTLQATVASTASMTRRAGLAINATVTTTVTVAKVVGTHIQATVASTASVLAARLFLVALTASATATAVLTSVVVATRRWAMRAGIKWPPGIEIRWPGHTDSKWSGTTSDRWPGDTGDKWD